MMTGRVCNTRFFVARLEANCQLGAYFACLQVNMQALVLVSLFRQQTRARIIEWIEWCLPNRIPYVRALNPTCLLT